MLERDEAALAAARKSWRFRRRAKRLLLIWFVIALVSAEAGASWFGFLIAHHAPLSLADAKVLGERIALGVLVISLLLTIVTMVFQLKARQSLRRLERILAQREGPSPGLTVNP